MTEQERLGSKKYYRDKEKDKELYVRLEEMLAKYITEEKLQDIAHGMDTNANESFNNTASWVAPKNKVYCGSRSLWNRISIAICIVSLGPEEFYQRLFKSMGIKITPNVLHYLSVKETQRSTRLEKIKTADKKMKRNKRKFDRLQEYTLVAKKERLVRAGKYRRGMNLDVTAEEELALPVRVKKEKVVCPHPFCGLTGHKTTKSKKCKANPERLMIEGTSAACAAACAAATAAVAAAAAGNIVPTMMPAAQRDLDQHEAVPLDDDSSIDMYEEAHTWSEDEEGNISAII